MDAPLKIFAEHSWKANNKNYVDYNGFPFMVGQKVYGTWVDADGRTYFAEGEIIYFQETGYWVENSSGGITPVKLFWTLNFNNDKQ